MESPILQLLTPKGWPVVGHNCFGVFKNIPVQERDDTIDVCSSISRRNACVLPLSSPFFLSSAKSRWINANGSLECSAMTMALPLELGLADLTLLTGPYVFRDVLFHGVPMKSLLDFSVCAPESVMSTRMS